MSLGIQHLRVLRWSPIGHNRSSDVLKIGTAVSRGQDARFTTLGNNLAKAYELYFELLSQEGDGLVIDGEPWAVELYICSGAFDAQRTGAAFWFLRASYGIDLFLGPYSSDLTLAAAKATQKAGAVLVAPGAADPNIFAGRDLVFGTLPAAPRFIAPAVDALAAQGAKTLAYVWEDSSGPWATCADLPELARERGLTLLFGALVAKQNVSEAVRQLAQADPDVVVGCVYKDLCVDLLLEARTQNLNPRAFLFSLCTTVPGFLPATNNLGRFSLGALPQIPILPVALDSRRLSFQELTSRWQYFHRTVEVPNYHIVSAFSSCAALALAAMRSGSSAPGAVAAVLRSGGHFRFDANGQSSHSTAVVQYRGFDRELHIVAPPDAAERSLWYPRPRWQGWICYDPDAPHAHAGFLADAPSQGGTCAECPAGKKSEFEPALGRRVCKECLPGQVLVTKEANGARTSACYPCIRGMMNVRVGGSGRCELCPKGKFQEQEGRTACNDCPAGRFSSSAGATICASCAGFPGVGTFYSMEPGSTTCYRCPVGGLCEPDAQGLHASITNEDTYYLLPGAGPSGQARIYQCFHGLGRACLSRGRCHRDLTGEVAMEGPMCGRCVKGFGRVDSRDGLCERCEGMGMAALSLLLNLIFSACLMGGVLFITFNTDFTKPLQIHSVILRQFMNYIQMAVVVSQRLSSNLLVVDVSGVLNFLSFFTSLTGVSDFAMQCLAWSVSPSTGFHHMEQLLGLGSVPLVVLLLTLSFELALWAASANGWHRPERSRLVTIVIVVLFSLHSPVTERNLSSWKCHHFDVPRLAADPSVECQGPGHRLWQLAGGIGFIAFSLGIPTALYHLLRYYHSRGRLRDADVCRMLGFLTCGFDPRFWYFECVFMLRKVLFHFIVLVPNLSAEGPERIEILQNTVLVLLSGGFFALHLSSRPFDNRCYNILDRIEAASLLAITMTPLLQRLTWEADKTLFFTNNAGLQRPRDVVCFAVLAALHGRVLVLMLWGLARGVVMRYLPESDDKRSCAWRFVWLFESDGEALIRPGGMSLLGVRGSSQRALCDMVQCIVRLHISRAGSLTFEGLAASVQRVIVEADSMRTMEALQRDNPVLYYFRRTREKFRNLRVGREAALAALARLEGHLRSRGWRMTTSSDRPSGNEHRVMPVVKTRDTTPFTGTNVLQACGKLFTVAELYGAMMQLGNEVYQEVCPLASLLTEEEDNDAMEGNIRSSTSSAHESAHPVAPVHAGLSDHLTRSQILNSELRAAKQENRHTAAALEGSRQETMRLLGALLRTEGRLRGSVEAAPGEEAGGAPFEQTCALAARRKDTVRLLGALLQTEEFLRVSRKTTCRPQRASAVDEGVAVARSSRMPCGQPGASTADEAAAVASDHVVLEDLPVGVETSLQPTRASVAPRRISARRSEAAAAAAPLPEAPAAQRGAGFPGRAASAAAQRGPARALLAEAKTGRLPIVPALPLAAAAGALRAQARPAASRAGEAQGDDASPAKSGSRAVIPSVRSSQASARLRELSRRHESMRESGISEGAVSELELGGLPAELDAAVERVEQTEFELESAQFQVYAAQRELALQARRGRELEARIAALEADSARLRSWRGGTPLTGGRVENFCKGLLHTLEVAKPSEQGAASKDGPKPPRSKSPVRTLRTRSLPRAARRRNRGALG